MQEFQQRVVTEKAELDDKISRLRPFLASETFKALPNDEQERLQTQLALMCSYSDVLGERIAAFTPPAQPPCDNDHVAEGCEKFTP